MAKSKKTPTDDRKAQFLAIGAKLAAKVGAKNVTRRMVAKEAGVADALVSHHLGGTDVAQRKYAAHAKKLGLTLPSKADAEAAGAALRKKPRKATKKVVAKKAVKAPAKKAAKKVAAKKPAAKATSAKRATAGNTQASRGPAASKPTAARKPKAPPVAPPPPPPPAADAAPPPPPPPAVGVV